MIIVRKLKASRIHLKEMSKLSISESMESSIFIIFMCMCINYRYYKNFIFFNLILSILILNRYS